MVETTGVEPVVPFGRRIYSPLGLPIFLHLHLTYYNTLPAICQRPDENYVSNLRNVCIKALFMDEPTCLLADRECFNTI